MNPRKQEILATVVWHNDAPCVPARPAARASWWQVTEYLMAVALIACVGLLLALTTIDHEPPYVDPGYPTPPHSNTPAQTQVINA